MIILCILRGEFISKIVTGTFALPQYRLGAPNLRLLIQGERKYCVGGIPGP